LKDQIELCKPKFLLQTLTKTKLTSKYCKRRVTNHFYVIGGACVF
jgi:hypothetical protein